MTLLEVMMAIMISTGIMAALFVFFIPWVNVFTMLVSNNDYRTTLVGVMDTIEKEASSMNTVYVDSSACYATCMVDNSGNRVYYYWDQASTSTYRNLYRKVEPITTSISCSGGQVFARNLNYSQTLFSNTNSLYTIKLVGRGDSERTNPFSVYNVIFPDRKSVV